MYQKSDVAVATKMKFKKKIIFLDLFRWIFCNLLMYYIRKKNKPLKIRKSKAMII